MDRSVLTILESQFLVMEHSLDWPPNLRYLTSLFQSLRQIFAQYCVYQMELG